MKNLTEKVISNEVIVNNIELASELADLATRREMFDNESIDEDSDEWNKMYVTDGDDTSYTDEAQDIFNGWYDYYTSQIEKYSAAHVPSKGNESAREPLEYILNLATYDDLAEDEKLASIVEYIKGYEVEQPKETRVYGVNHNELPDDFNANKLLANDDFIEVAEEQGNVWSLKGFEEQFNNDGDEVNQNNLSIRII